MILLDKIKIKIFWNQEFDREWRRATEFCDVFTEKEKLAQGLAWRERYGKIRCRNSPSHAAYYAFEDLANDFFRQHRNDQSDNLDEIAYRLYMACPFYSYPQMQWLEDRTVNMSELWRERGKRVHNERRQAREEERRETEEIENIRFTLKDIKDAFQLMLNEGPPPIALELWSLIKRDHNPYDLARILDYDISEVMFWLIVFKENKLAYEHVRWHRHYYVRNIEVNDLKLAIQKIKPSHPQAPETP